MKKRLLFLMAALGLTLLGCQAPPTKQRPNIEWSEGKCYVLENFGLYKTSRIDIPIKNGLAPNILYQRNFLEAVPAGKVEIKRKEIKEYIVQSEVIFKGFHHDGTKADTTFIITRREVAPKGSDLYYFLMFRLQKTLKVCKTPETSHQNKRLSI